MKILTALLLLLTFSAQSQISDLKKESAQIDKKLKSEVERSANEGATQGALTEAINSYDRLLNSYYKYCLTVYADDCKKLLIESQKSWLTWMVKELAFIEKKHGAGAISKTLFLTNKLEIIKQRVNAIYDFASNAELSDCFK